MNKSGILGRFRETKTNAVNREEIYNQLQDYFELLYMFADALHSHQLSLKLELHLHNKLIFQEHN